jgi:hypothetical protein
MPKLNGLNPTLTTLDLTAGVFSLHAYTTELKHGIALTKPAKPTGVFSLHAYTTLGADFDRQTRG